MAGPWEAYQTQPAAAKGPWSQYQPEEAALDLTTPNETNQIPAPRKSYEWSDVPGTALANAPSSAKHMAQGMAEAVAHPIDTLNVLRQGVRGGLYNVLPEDVQNFWSRTSRDPESLKKAVDTANAIGGIYKDRYGSIDSLKRTMAEDPFGAAADLSTILMGGGAAATKLSAVKTGAALGKAAEFTNPVSLITKPVNAMVTARQGNLNTQQQLNAVRDQTLAAGQKEGYVVTPGAVSPTGANIMTERLAGKTHLEQLASVKNQATTDKLARRAVGIDETAPLTSDAMKAIRNEEFRKGYEPINQIGAVATDANYVAELDNVIAKFRGASASFPGAVPDNVTNLVKAFKKGTFNSGDAIAATRMLREQAKGNFRTGDNGLAKAQLAISEALENQIERKLMATNQTDLLDQFKNSRQRMAISHTIEDAIREGTGTVDPKKLARDIQSGKYMSGELKTAAEFANTFPRVSQSAAGIGAPGAGSILGRSGAGLVGAGAGYLLGGTPGAAAGLTLGAQFAPEVVSSGLRNYLLSKTGQARIAPNYEQNFMLRNLNDTTARNALLAAQAGKQNNLGR
jgi:hypothetical protein